MASKEILQAVAVTAELTGTQLSEAAARMLINDLAGEDETELLAALTRCRRELKGRLTVGEILSRIPSGHPSPEEAWAMVHHALGDERETLVVTGPMRTAFFAADSLCDDKIAARMTFLEVYKREIGAANRKPQWGVIAGWDLTRRSDVVGQAVIAGKLPERVAQQYLSPPEKPSGRVLELIKGVAA